METSLLKYDSKLLSNTQNRYYIYLIKGANVFPIFLKKLSIYILVR